MSSFNYQDAIFSFNLIDDRSWDHPGFINFIRIYSELKKISQPINILDIGCGAGAMIASLQQKLPQHKYTGIDISAKAINYGKSHFPNITLMQSSANTIPLESSSYDLIIISEVLEHIHEVEKTIQESTRIMRPGGKIYITCPLEKSMFTMQGIFLRLTGIVLSYYTTGHINYFNEKELLSLLEKYSLTLNKKSYSQHLIWQAIATIYQLTLILQNKPITNPPKELSILQKISALLTNYESELCKNLPGSDIQIIASKKYV